MDSNQRKAWQLRLLGHPEMWDTYQEQERIKDHQTLEDETRFSPAWKAIHHSDPIQNYKKFGLDEKGRKNAFRSRVKHCTPKWVNKEEIYQIYREAYEKGLEVDHIYPINGELSCGLHVPCNLQLLSKAENARKGNKIKGES